MAETQDDQHQQIDVAVGALVEYRPVPEPEAGSASRSDLSDRPVSLLITRRPESGVLGGYWELPGGKVEPGEDLRDCLVREFEEEVGLTVSVGPQLSPIEYEYPHGHVKLHPYFCFRVAGEPQNLAVTEHRWVLPNELPEFKFPAANLPLLEEIVEALSSGEPDLHTSLMTRERRNR